MAGDDLTRAGQRPARVGEGLLRDTGFVPTFALEPSLWTALERALEMVERDVHATGITGTLRLVIPDWDVGGQAWVEFRGTHHGNGIRPIAGSRHQLPPGRHEPRPLA
ncbi:hypothetical protein AB0B89_31990 [Sphaerisporangium sp. NPDC049002]|uniref:hypothetical protein n=1 Tax=Sphaerisporangium sp. NPDC049002 TaxID=3155392 RepID=UPI0033F02DB6